jgi:hypothetical protein
MAITIRQEPTTPNQANADLLYVLSSTNQNQPQFQYVMEVSDGADTYKFTQQPNPSGKGIFDIGQVASDFLDTDTPFKTPFVQTSTNSGKTLSTVFYEEYGTSSSSSVSLYNGISGSGVYVLDGVVEPDSGDWNFASSSFYTSSFTPAAGAGNYNLQHGLTNSPLTQSIKDDEYQTLSIINGNFEGEEFNAQDIYYIQVNVYNEAGTNVQNFGWFNLDSGSINGGPRVLDTQYYNDVFGSLTDGQRLIHVAAGPQNFADAGNTLNSNWYSYKVTLMGQESPGIEDGGAVYAEKWFTKSEGECGYSGTRFAFLNELGGYDYYSFDLADTKQDNITRETYEKTFVPYSTTTNSAVYNKSRRGNKVYSMSYETTRTAESVYLTQEEADWLRELVESPEVYIQEGTDFIPIVIQNTNFTYKTNPRSQKLYTLSVQYKMSNNRRSR